MYNETRVEAKMEPWGAPQVKGAAEETELPMATEKVLLVKKDLNQFNAHPLMPTQCSRRNSRI